jgi:hypothetical protein
MSAFAMFKRRHYSQPVDAESRASQGEQILQPTVSHLQLVKSMPPAAGEKWASLTSSSSFAIRVRQIWEAKINYPYFGTPQLVQVHEQSGLSSTWPPRVPTNNANIKDTIHKITFYRHCQDPSPTVFLEYYLLLSSNTPVRRFILQNPSYQRSSLHFASVLRLT